MEAMSPSSTPSGARRAGYLIAILVNAALAWVVNVWPGWQEVPFLTADTAEVIPLVNASLLVGILSNTVFLLRDPAWLRALSSLVTTGISAAVTARLIALFPFDFGDDASTWDPIVEVLLILLLVVTVLALVVQLVQFIRLLIVGEPDRAGEDRAVEVR